MSIKSQMFKEMTYDIEAARDAHNFSNESPFFRCITRHGTRLQCNNTPEAVDALIAKVRNGVRRTRPPKEITPSVSRAPKLRPEVAFASLLETESRQTALSYAELCGLPVYFFSLGGYVTPLCRVSFEHNGVILFGFFQKWRCVHVASGTLLCSGTSKKDVCLFISQVRAYGQDLLSNVTETRFQEKARYYYGLTATPSVPVI